MAARKTEDKKTSRQGQLRIVAGNWRSRLLQIADVPGLRPTAARIRETLFNWLGPGIHGASCLDLCAGTGALGIEALSRGASRAVFVEPSPLATAVLKSNIASLNASGAEVLNIDAQSYLRGPNVEPFDVVFVDPPFVTDLQSELCRLLTLQRWLAADARIYIEMDRDRPELRLTDGWQELKNKMAGQVRYVLAKTSPEGVG